MLFNQDQYCYLCQIQNKKQVNYFSRFIKNINITLYKCNFVIKELKNKEKKEAFDFSNDLLINNMNDKLLEKQHNN